MKTFSRYLHYPYLFFATCILLTSCNGTENNETTKIGVNTDPSGYQLSWSDEFNGSAVDTSNWVYDMGNNGWGNHEQEYYQPANATIEDGNLVITGNKEDVQSGHYTSTRMKTKGKHEFLYGKIEARIKMPVGQGFWPAFWMLGANIDSVGWPASGEVDIMEHINADSLLYGTLHWDDNGHVQSGDTLAFTPSAFHIYAVEWDSASISWYLDGTKYHEVAISDSANNNDEFHKPQFILLDLALGGDWPGQQIDDSKLPAKMYVDYVRVYKKSE
ncbi:glycoside hydrolase family 16 protein [soil metagenome]